MHFLRRLLESGIAPHMEPELAKRLKMSNEISLLIMFLVIPYSAIFFFLGHPLMGPLLLPIGAMFFPVVYFNKKGNTTLSRTWLIVGMNVVLGTYAWVFGREAGLHLLFFVFVGVPFLIFSLSEAIPLALGVVLSTALFYAIQFGPVLDQPQNTQADKIIYFTLVTLVILWTVVNYTSFSLAGRENEAQLQRKEKQFRELLEHAPDAMVICTQDATITMVNSRFRRFFGYKLEEIIGKKFTTLVAPQQAFADEAQWISFCETTIKSTSTLFAEQVLKTRNGATFTAELATTHLETDAGLMISTSIRDIAERRQLETLKIKAASSDARNKELEQFAYIVSHDLKSPVQNTLQLIDLLKKYADDKDEKEKILSMISSSVTRMQTLIKDLLAFSTTGGGETRDVNCTTVVDEIRQDLSSIISKTKAEIKVGQLPTVKGQPSAIRMVFQNLINNAIKFHARGAKPVVEISSLAVNGHWQFAVRDNGIGIPEKETSRIFGAFQRLHSASDYEGHGLGLAHCKKIVSHHGGSIWVESEPNKGSTFYFTLPRVV